MQFTLFFAIYRLDLSLIFVRISKSSELMNKISVIVPVYNVENYLGQCLDSVVNQTFKDIEIICVNDCSTDNSLAILNEYAKKDSRIKVIDLDKNVGLACVRNIAHKYVTGEYIMYLDSDDWLELNACELAYNQIKHNNNDLVYFGIYIFDDSKHTKYVDKKRLAVFEKYKNRSNIRYSDIDEPFMSFCECWYKIYKTEFIKKYNLEFESGKTYEDMPFYYNLILTDANFSVLDVPLYNYRKRAGQITANPKYWYDLLFVRDKAFKNILKSENSKYIKFYVITYLNSILAHYKRFSNIDENFEYEHFQELQGILKSLSEVVSIDEIKDYIKYKKIKRIINVNHNFKKKVLFGKKFLSFHNKNLYREMKVFGIKIKFKKEYNKIDKIFKHIKEAKNLNRLKDNISASEIHDNTLDFCKTNNNDKNIYNVISSLCEFCFIPNKGNLGDVAIAVACYQYFDTNKFKYTVADMTKQNKIASNIVYGGGGLFVRNYQDVYQNILEYFKSSKVKNVVILPASFYDCPDVLEVMDERFTVFCREKQSYMYCCANNKKAKFYLADDMVFGLNLDFYRGGLIDKVQIKQNIEKITPQDICKLKYEIYPFLKRVFKIFDSVLSEGNDTGVFLRTDTETTGISNAKSLIDLSLLYNSYCADKAMCIIFLRKFLATLDKFQKIITDRLHIGVCSMLLGKDVYLLDNSYKKCSNVYNYSMRDKNNVKLVSDSMALIKWLPENDYTILSGIEELPFEEFLMEWLSINNTFGVEKRYWSKYND